MPPNNDGLTPGITYSLAIPGFFPCQIRPRGPRDAIWQIDFDGVGAFPNVQHCSAPVAAKVVYEIRMFRLAYDKLYQLELDLEHIQPGDVELRVGTGISTDAVRDASVLVECFLLHARVLRDFFCRRRHRTDDVIAKDFVRRWKPPRKTAYKYLLAEKDRMDKALAHLTTFRVKYDGDGKQWDLHKIKQELDQMIIRFLKEVEATAHTSWFDDAR